MESTWDNLVRIVFSDYTNHQKVAENISEALRIETDHVGPRSLTSLAFKQFSTNQLKKEEVIKNMTDLLIRAPLPPRYHHYLPDGSLRMKATLKYAIHRNEDRIGVEIDGRIGKVFARGQMLLEMPVGRRFQRIMEFCHLAAKRVCITYAMTNAEPPRAYTQSGPSLSRFIRELQQDNNASDASRHRNRYQPSSRDPTIVFRCCQGMTGRALSNSSS